MCHLFLVIKKLQMKKTMQENELKNHTYAQQNMFVNAIKKEFER